MSDIEERKFWKDYQHAYERMIQNTAKKHSPWYIAPADNKWYTRLVIASAIIEELAGLDLQFPDVDKAKKKELEGVKESLLAEKD
jgi:polyphosphate kinase 2 (PPK2 family)